MAIYDIYGFMDSYGIVFITAMLFRFFRRPAQMVVHPRSVIDSTAANVTEVLVADNGKFEAMGKREN